MAQRFYRSPLSSDMRTLAKWLAAALIVPALATAADTDWVLTQSTLAYHVSHPLHQIDGVSHDAKGKGVCREGQCDFLVAVPVKSFTSGDSNRDLHMIQVTRGAEFPMVTVRFRLPESAASQKAVNVDLEIEFAGQTAHYKQVPFQLVMHGNDARITGEIPAKMTDFKITPPSLLAIPTKDEMPVRVDMTWRRM